MGGAYITKFYHTTNGQAGSYVDVTVERPTDEWYLLFNFSIDGNYDTWRSVTINGTAITISSLASDSVQIGNQSGNYGCFIIPMDTQLNKDDVVRITNVQQIAGVGLILCKQ